MKQNIINSVNSRHIAINSILLLEKGVLTCETPSNLLHWLFLLSNKSNDTFGKLCMAQNNICKFYLRGKIFLSFIFNYSNNSYAFLYVFVHPIRKYFLSVQYVISSYCNLYPLCANICLILLLRIYLQVSCCGTKRIGLFVCGKIKSTLYILS